MGPCREPTPPGPRRSLPPIQAHRHDTRYALLLHRHADQLVGHLHRDLVVRDEENWVCSDMRLTMRKKRTCWRRPAALRPRPTGRTAPGSAEHREHQRRRSQRLFAARKQVDGRVLLARRLGHHLHARIEDLVAGHGHRQHRAISAISSAAADTAERAAMKTKANEPTLKCPSSILDQYLSLGI
jgi:hypothetical protein